MTFGCEQSIRIAFLTVVVASMTSWTDGLLAQTLSQSKTDFFKYEFRQRATGGRLPIFGDVFIERDGPRFVYRIWNWQPAHLFDMRAKFRPQLENACGFDGETFWLVVFPDTYGWIEKNDNNQSKQWVIGKDAPEIFCTESIFAFSNIKSKMPARFGRDPQNAFLQVAVFHSMFEALHCDSFDFESIKSSAIKLGLVADGTEGDAIPLTFEMERGEKTDNQVWNVSFSVDKELFPIAELRFEYRDTFFGRWGKWLPPTFRVARTDEVKLDKLGLLDWKTYSNGKLEFIEIVMSK